MGDLALKPQWHDNIEQIEKGDLVLGGPNGKANRQAKQLAESLLFFRQQQDALNDQYTLYFDTVADLVVTEGLKDGLVVATKGYYIAGDGGGARYLISSIAMDYSIPLSNDLHAIFSDSFDIRKFGIRNSATLDQTTEIQRMVNYADTRVYEIDFLNYSLMTPSIVHWTTGRGSIIKGMGFKKPHHLKNLTIANDKTKQLYQGTSPILFSPDDPNGTGLFKLSNIKFDPYVSNFKLVSGEADGYMCGFAIDWHPDANQVYPSSNQFVTGYDIDLDDIEFLSPAVSYNLACAGIFTRNLKANNVRGDYWGIMLCHHTYNLDANNIHGVFRDDLHTPSGRVLVTNLIHEEAEIANEGIITRNNITVKNSSCFKKTDGSEYVVYKCHRIGTITINNFVADNNLGFYEFYGGVAEADRRRLIIDNLKISNISTLAFNASAQVNNAEFSDIKKTASNILDYSYWKNVFFKNINTVKRALSITDCSVDNLVLTNLQECLDQDYGLIRGPAIVKNISIQNVTCKQPKLIECSFEVITIDGLITSYRDGILNNLIFNTSPVSSVAEISNSTISCSGLYSGATASYFYSSVSKETADNLRLNNTTLVNCCANGNVVPKYANCRIEMTAGLPYFFNYDPPSLATNTTQLKTVPLQGAKIGDAVAVAFDKPLQGTRIWGEVTAPDTITIYHRNDTGVTVDVANGTFTIKIV